MIPKPAQDRCFSCRLSVSRAAIVTIFCGLTLIAVYSKTHISDIGMESVSSQLPPDNICTKEPLHIHRIPWDLKDEHPNSSVTDILNLEMPDYADDFKNPCWREQKLSGIRIRCLPYFFIAGMPKSGTTDLWNSLGKHPQVRIHTKEPHWWTRRRYSTDISKSSMESYVKYFDRPAKAINMNSTEKDGKPYHPLITGDGSASTFWDNFHWRKIPQNCNSTIEPKIVHAHLIKHLLPNAKIIVILRNPVDRMYSDYLYFNRNEPKSQEEFHSQCVHVLSSWKACVKKYTRRHCVYGTIANLTTHVRVRFFPNMYSVYVKEWLNVFPRDQLHFIGLGKYSDNRAKVLQGVFKFLDLDPIHRTEYINHLPIQNQRRAKDRVVGPMFNKTRELLEEFYQPYNEELAYLLQDRQFLFV